MLKQFAARQLCGKKTTSGRRAVYLAAMLTVAAAMSACGSGKEKTNSQVLASVNGDEITALQLNEELQRTNIPAEQQAAAGKQLLEALIDRELLQQAAEKSKIDRDPAVMQAIERSKSLIVAQAYMQKVVGAQAKPTPPEVAAYFESHAEFFAHRKQFDMVQLVFATKDLDQAMATAMESANGIEQAMAYFDAHQIKYVRNQVTRSTSDLPADMGSKLQSMGKGQLLIVREGERSLLVTVTSVKDAPVTLAVAATQIEQYMANQKAKDIAKAEIARLRAAAKIDYANKSAAPAASATPAAAPAAAATPAASDSTARGVAGLK